MTTVIDWNRPPSEGHFVRRPYGAPAPWPKGRPATWAPVMLHQTRYAKDSVPLTPGVIVTAPRGQSVPVRALGNEPEKPKDTRTFAERHPDATAIAKQGGSELAEHKVSILIGLGLLTILGLGFFRAIGKITGSAGS